MAINSINSRFGDSLERELLQSASNGSQAYSVLEGLGIVADTVGRAASAFGRYVIQVSEALNEARARDARYMGAQW